MYRLAVENRPIDTATIKNTWPMPNVDAVLQDMPNAESFEAIDVKSSYWKLPMRRDGQALHSFMTPDSIMKPPRTTKGGFKSAAIFLACVVPCSGEFFESLLALLDDFVLHNRTETGLLHILERFLQICEEYRLVLSFPRSAIFATEIKW